MEEQMRLWVRLVRALPLVEPVRQLLPLRASLVNELLNSLRCRCRQKVACVHVSHKYWCALWSDMSKAVKDWQDAFKQWEHGLKLGSQVVAKCAREKCQNYPPLWAHTMWPWLNFSKKCWTCENTRCKCYSCCKTTDSNRHDVCMYNSRPLQY